MVAILDSCALATTGMLMANSATAHNKGANTVFMEITVKPKRLSVSLAATADEVIRKGHKQLEDALGDSVIGGLHIRFQHRIE